MNTPTPHAESATRIVATESRSLDGVICDAVTAAMNAAMPHLPPIFWTTRGGTGPLTLSGIPDTEGEFEQWVAELRLSAVDALTPGTRRAEGTIAFGRNEMPHHVCMWVIVDEAIYMAATRSEPGS